LLTFWLHNRNPANCCFRPKAKAAMLTAFDSSKVAREKALKFAQEKSVSIDYQFLDIADYKAEKNAFDLIALVFVHLPEALRKLFHQELIRALKPGGILMAALFAKEQIHQNSGGPPLIDLLYSKEILRQDFHKLNIKKIDHVQTHLDEGRHQGRGAASGPGPGDRAPHAQDQAGRCFWLFPWLPPD